MGSSRVILKRVYVVYFLMLLFGMVIIVKVFAIQFGEGDKWKEKAGKLTLVNKKVEGHRGNIFADDERLLATSVPIFEIRVDFKASGLDQKTFDENIDSLAYQMSDFFGDHPALHYKDKYYAAWERGERYFLIKRGLNYNQLKVVKTFPLFRLPRNKGGFIVEKQTRRVKPFKMLASRTLGKVGNKSAGTRSVGLEAAYDEYLKGVSGMRLMRRIYGGWMDVSGENGVEPEDGSDIYTSIDLNIQDVAETALLRQLKEHDAHHGCVVIMEVGTGEVKAIANLTRTESGEYIEAYNYAVGEIIEPGSTQKLASYLVAIEDGYIEPEDSVDTRNGRYMFYRTPMFDSRPHGKITYQRAFEVSSNIAVARMANEYYGKNPQRYIDNLRALHMGEKLGIEIPGEGKPYLKSTSDSTWSGISLPWISHGYELTMTPLQILTLYNAVANDGRMMKPMFVREIRKRDQIVEKYHPEVIEEAICSPSTIQKLKRMLEGVVQNGTATNLKHPDYKIAGKTGTTQLNYDRVAGRRRNSKIEYQASFAGYFPAEKPKYSCIVVINRPSNNVFYGHQVAGPVFKEVADKVYATSIDIHDDLEKQEITAATAIPVSKNGYQPDLVRVFDELGVNYKLDDPTSNWAVTLTGEEDVEIKRRAVKPGEMPNVKGMNIQDALYILENMGANVRFSGRGFVREQSIKPGTALERGDQIELQLSS